MTSQTGPRFIQINLKLTILLLPIFMALFLLSKCVGETTQTDPKGYYKPDVGEIVYVDEGTGVTYVIRSIYPLESVSNESAYPLGIFASLNSLNPEIKQALVNLHREIDYGNSFAIRLPDSNQNDAVFIIQDGENNVTYELHVNPATLYVSEITEIDLPDEIMTYGWQYIKIEDIKNFETMIATVIDKTGGGIYSRSFEFKLYGLYIAQGTYAIDEDLILLNTSTQAITVLKWEDIKSVLLDQIKVNQTFDEMFKANFPATGDIRLIRVEDDGSLIFLVQADFGDLEGVRAVEFEVEIVDGIISAEQIVQGEEGS